MTEVKQSNNTKEKVSYVLLVQDLGSTTAATYDTSYNVEQNLKMIEFLRGEGVLWDPSGSSTLPCYVVVVLSPFLLSAHKITYLRFFRPLPNMTTVSHGSIKNAPFEYFFCFMG